MSAPVAIGVDNGGTWIRMVGLDATGRCVWTLKIASPTVDKLPHFLKRRLRRFKGKLEALAVGSRGVWKPAKRLAVQRALKGLARKIVVMSDVEAAWLTAFGVGGQGIVVIAGTGSIAYGRKSDGTIARAGGLGPDKGDEGSGYWIGNEWRRRTGRFNGRGKSVRDIASLAPRVIVRARHKDPLAREIIGQAQNELAKIVIELSRKLFRKGIIPLSVSGSVLEDPWFQRGFFRALPTRRYQRRPLKTNAATTLARSIISHAAG